MNQSPSRAELFASLSQHIRSQLETLEKSVQSALGADLTALLVFGSLVRGEFREGTSDIELFLVLKEARHEKLDAVSNALAVARYAIRAEAMIVAADEIPRAGDVFPLLYDDIRRSHVLLLGADPFQGLEISNRHRRLRVEQELREAQIRLRRVQVDARGATEALVPPLLRKLRQLRLPMRALLELRGVEAPDGTDEILRAVGKLYGLETEPLFKLREAPLATVTALSALLRAAVHDVDQMEPSAV